MVSNLSYHIAPYEKVSEAIAHFLNCFLGETEGGGGGRGLVDDTATVPVNGHSSNSGSKKRQKKKRVLKGRSSTG